MPRNVALGERMRNRVQENQTWELLQHCAPRHAPLGHTGSVAPQASSPVSQYVGTSPRLHLQSFSCGSISACLQQSRGLRRCRQSSYSNFVPRHDLLLRLGRNGRSGAILVTPPKKCPPALNLFPTTLSGSISHTPASPPAKLQDSPIII